MAPSSVPDNRRAEKAVQLQAIGETTRFDSSPHRLVCKQHCLFSMPSKETNDCQGLWRCNADTQLSMDTKNEIEDDVRSEVVVYNQKQPNKANSRSQTAGMQRELLLLLCNLIT